MASIIISDLRPSGFDLFGDSESFLDDLSDNDLATINGGFSITWFVVGIIIGIIIGVEAAEVIEVVANE